MNSAEIRSKFLEYFASKGHAVVPSSSLVPADDPTLLFTNAGMVQFKNVFLGLDERPYTRATTAQRSVRAGGKHNDLENVGYTTRHHTFFEMLGNFSFGDYFKKEAILYAWELLVDVYRFDPQKLWVTVYHEDDEAYDIWLNQVGIAKERLIRIGDNKGARYASDNFWQMADTGPCGPCSEIFFDHGPEVAGGPPGSPDDGGDRYIEIWNLVFMQFNRDEEGVLHPLPKPCVDTGMGLERLAAVLQHVHSNYEIDLFSRLIEAAARETGTADLASPSLKVIADHIRASAFLIVDGIIPGNEGRGYVLRRIIRRALRHGHKLGQKSPFFYKLVAKLAAEMGDAYPELRAAQQQIAEVLKQEEERFGETLNHGMQILEQALSGGGQVLDGSTAFRLYDTYGFPLDLTADICRERGIGIDEAGFDIHMEKQRAQAREHSQFKQQSQVDYSGPKTIFHGYTSMEYETEVVALYREGIAVERLDADETGFVVLGQTPFYAESGGQTGDRGELVTLDVPPARFIVGDTQKIQPEVFAHYGVLQSGRLKVGDRVVARVDAASRAATMRNHSATHLMHKALREVLGDHVQQRGSLVDGERTRFDFTHHMAMSNAQISQVERRVNLEILANTDTCVRTMPMDDARRLGAMALFGEKYGDEVRVVDIGSSRELCGGTHVAQCGDIGFFKITGEGGIAAGVRRIEAVTGANALTWVQQQEEQLRHTVNVLKVPPQELSGKAQQLLEQIKGLEKEVARYKSRLAAGQSDDLLAEAKTIKNVKVLSSVVEGVDIPGMRALLDKLKDKLGSGVVVLATVTTDGKVNLIAGVTADLVKAGRLKAGDIVNAVAQQVGGKGGGRPDMAQAGGTQPENLPSALASVPAWVEKTL